MSPNRKSWAPLSALILLAALLEALFLWLLHNQTLDAQPLDARVPETVAILLAAGALHLTAFYLVWRFDLRGRAPVLIILLAALAFRATLWPLPPSLSNDLYRYAWEGRLQVEGYNPYAHAPSSPEVAHLRPPEYPVLPGRDVPAAYGPAAELVFRVAAAFGGLPAFKLASVLFDLISLALLLLLLRGRGDPPARARVYAWCPVVLVYFAGQGHNDSLMVALILLGLWLLSLGKNMAASAALAAATMAKWTAGLLLPLIVRRHGWRTLPVAVGTAFLIAAPFIDPGANLLAGLGAYAQKWRNNASLFEVFSWLTGEDSVALGIGAGVVAGLALFLAWRKTEPLRAGFLLMAAVLLLAPSVFPWYLTWLIPFLAFFPHPALLLWSATVMLSYHVVIGYSANGVWEYDPWLTALQYAPVYGLLIGEGWARRRATASSGGKPSELEADDQAG